MRPVLAVLMCAVLVAASCDSAPRSVPVVSSRSSAGAALPEGVHEVAPGVYSGPMPEDAGGFEALAALGVRSVISVDGARPGIEGAASCDMSYSHVPIRYSGIEEGELDQIARALRDVERPVYVHCHHGKHRGPAAAAAGLIALGEIDNGQGLALLETAGTSPSYPGLWEAVRGGRRLESAELDAAPVAPPVARVSDFVAGMSVVDHAWDNLRLCRDSGWAAPTDHPDLVPASEAGILADALRDSMGDPSIADKPSDFHAWMRESHAAASELERLIVAGAPRARVDAGFEELAATCKACHSKYRN